MLRRIITLSVVAVTAACTDASSPPVTRQLTAILAGSSGSVTSSPSGINCTLNAGATNGSCSAAFNEGAQVTLTATPLVGHVFSGWSGACSGAGACSVTMSGATTVTATFAATQHQLTIALAGTGTGTVVSAPVGINCIAALGGGTTGCSGPFDFGTNVTLTATAAASHTFQGWSGACTGLGTCLVSVTEAKNVTATFGGPLKLTVTTSGSGEGSVTSNPPGINCTRTGGAESGTCNASFAISTQVQLTATGVNGTVFTGWGGDCSGVSTCTVTLDQVRSANAAFTGPPQSLQLAVSGTGNGTITSSPSGINCTRTNGNNTGACQFSFPFGTSVTLTAVGVAGHAFAGWGNACSGTGTCVVAMTQLQIVSATFSTVPPLQFNLTLNGIGEGTVTSSPNGIACTRVAGANGGTCATQFPTGAQITLTAVPTAGNTFAGWSGDCTGTGACVVTMSQARNVTGTFSTNATGGISGIISDASTSVVFGGAAAAMALPISGATVELRVGPSSVNGPALLTTTTNASGAYQFSNLPPDTYTVLALATGFQTNFRGNITVGSTVVTGQDVALTPGQAVQQTRISVTWNNTLDLDTHLTGPDPSGLGTSCGTVAPGRFHVFWCDPGDGNGPPFAFLFPDDEDGFGPEQITITNQTAGVYRFSVHDFTNVLSTTSSALAGSGAQVQVFRDNVLTNTFNVPAGAGTLWTVFEMSGSTITPVNAMTFSTDAGTISLRAGGATTDTDIIGLVRRLKPPR